MHMMLSCTDVYRMYNGMYTDVRLSRTKIQHWIKNEKNISGLSLIALAEIAEDEIRFT